MAPAHRVSSPPAGILAALAAPAVAQENGKEWVWKTDGKRYWRTEEAVKPFVMPATYLKEVPAGEEKAGDVQGFKDLGKNTEKVFFRETPFAEAPQGHECTWKMVYEKKAVNKNHLCLVNGAEKPCPGMNEAGKCASRNCYSGLRSRALRLRASCAAWRSA